MKRLKKVGVVVAVVAALYVLLPLAVFDFSSVAVPYDEENFGSQQVAIGPRPRWWVPGAARHLDIPGGFDYEPSGWAFVVWKPLCVAFDRAHGYALPAEWR
jgi:hypothetical protein